MNPSGPPPERFPRRRGDRPYGPMKASAGMEMPVPPQARG